MKNPNDPIGNRIRDLQASGATTNQAAVYPSVWYNKTA